VTGGQLPQRAGSLGLNGGGAAAAVPPRDQQRILLRSNTEVTKSTVIKINVQHIKCGSTVYQATMINHMKHGGLSITST